MSLCPKFRICPRRGVRCCPTACGRTARRRSSTTPRRREVRFSSAKTKHWGQRCVGRPLLLLAEKSVNFWLHWDGWVLKPNFISRFFLLAKTRVLFLVGGAGCEALLYGKPPIHSSKPRINAQPHGGAVSGFSKRKQRGGGEKWFDNRGPSIPRLFWLPE